ncbi:MAG: AMP-binding protein [Bacteroidia bacterium]|nr:AMP-binding protein [Bacteroidia bacterium]
MPKTLALHRKKMEWSCRQTGTFLHIKPGDEIFCCLPLNKISGIMQLARSRVWCVPITVSEPAADPMNVCPETATITSLTPFQLTRILASTDSTAKLNALRIVLIGGGSIDAQTETKLKGMSPEFYHTYGMTETYSHIALRRIGYETGYRLFPGIEVKNNASGELLIRCEITSGKWLETHDIVRIEGEFLYPVGRTDDIINSGGLKLNPLELEHEISQHTGWPLHLFFIAGIPDPVLGQKAVLFLANEFGEPDQMSDLSFLQGARKPKEIRFLPKFAYTDTGKIHRNKTLVINGILPAEPESRQF